MMQPMDPLAQLAMCCGLGGRRKDYKAPANCLYSPSSAHLAATGSGWPLAASTMMPYAPRPQPYFFLSQPVIIAGNSAQNQASTMTLVQHAQAAQNPCAFPGLSLFGQQAVASHQPQMLQPSIVSSQYAIYSAPAGVRTNPIATTNTNSVYEQRIDAIDRGQNMFLASKPAPIRLASLAESSTNLQQFSERRPPKTLSSDIFQQLEVIDKQVDLSRDMELIERHGIVITRALDPYSLMPHLTEEMLRRYHSQFLFSDEHVIRFIEVIKRPGQTLGLYIRTVLSESPQGRGFRPGLVITKIDSDSPVYNSQVLHVGDEILSVNLVDIQGMSLDDVVIIMSIPKRLVLALRIPRERDQLLSLDLMRQQHQQQQQQRMLQSRMEQRDFTLPAPNSYKQKPQVVPFRDDQALRYMGNNFGPQVQAAAFGGPTLGGHPGGEMGRRVGPMDQPDRGLYDARPIRVQSAAQMNDNMLDLAGQDDGELSRGNFDRQELPRRYSSLGSYRQEVCNFDKIGANPMAADEEQQQQQQRQQDYHQRFVNQMIDSGDRSREELRDMRASLVQKQQLPNQETNLSGHEFGLGSEQALLGNPASGGYLERDRYEPNDPMLSTSKDLSLSVGVDGVSASASIPQAPAPQIPGTFPRRTLPAQPGNVESPASISRKPPAISSLRLGDTPEQSSYFSSSIDAINRELKELRRQRMALSENEHEHSIDSPRADF